jgi:hypothetical protein
VVARPRTSRRQIAELSFILRAILDDIAASGGSKGTVQRAALDLVDAFTRGEAPTSEALTSARDDVAKAIERFGVSSPPVWKALYWVPIAALIGMVESGVDSADHVLLHAGYALSSMGAAARLDGMRTQARTDAAGIDHAPLPAPERAIPDDVLADEAALLARSRAAFTGEALELFDFVQPARDAAQTTDRATLAKRLEQHDLPANESVLAFEETFGGLLLPLTTYDDWRDQGLYTMIGPSAMLDTHAAPPTGGTLGETTLLVPVARGSQEDIYFLDEDGAPYFHETMGERSAVPFGADGTELVTRLLFGALVFAAQELRGTPVSPPVNRIASAAAQLELTRLFADDATEWWCGSAAVIVVFRGQVWGLARTPEAIVALA